MAFLKCFQNLSEIVELPGIDDDELIDEIEAQAMGYRAFR